MTIRALFDIRSRIFSRSAEALALASAFLWSDVAWCQCTSFNMRDANGDRHIDLVDHSVFVDCFAGPGAQPQPTLPRTAAECLFLFDGAVDDFVDLQNFQGLQNSFTGSIRPECFNIVFASSEKYYPILGSATAYDVKCNELASAAGINNATSTAFMAWVSDAQSSARVRLGNARGFVRIDGLPVADTVASLLQSSAILNPINVNELGGLVYAQSVMTGTNADGSSNPYNCANWTSTTSLGWAGNSAAGPEWWTEGFRGCNQGAYHIYCFQKTISRALPAMGRQGRLVYVTQGLFTPGTGASPHELCNAEKPEGMGAVYALVAGDGYAMDVWLDPTAEYVRPDGQLVGIGSDLLWSNLQSGIWQTSEGVYISPDSLAAQVWTGSSEPGAPGSTTSSCSNWTSQTSTAGVAGEAVFTNTYWWNARSLSCATASRLYCVED